MFTSTNSINKQELSRPLLDLEEKELVKPSTSFSEDEFDFEYDDDDDKCETGCTMTCTIHSDNDDNEELCNKVGEEEAADCDSCLCKRWVVLFVFPTLLFLQFGMAFTVANNAALASLSSEDDSISSSYDVETEEQARELSSSLQSEMDQLDWMTVNYSIVLFVAAAYLYRKALNNSGYAEHLIFQLVPEITVDIVLGLVLFHYVVYGFLLMVFMTCVMASYSAFSSCRLMVQYDVGCDDDDVEEATKDDEDLKCATVC